MMSEGEMAEAAALTAETLGIDLSDPSSFSKAERVLQAAEHGFIPPRFDVRAVRQFLNALSNAAQQRGVDAAQLWNALDALERC
jgi:hypothetical protein